MIVNTGGQLRCSLVDLGALRIVHKAFLSGITKFLA